MSTIAETRRGPFSDYFSVTLLAGCLCAHAVVWRGWSVLAGPVLLTIPGIVQRSFPRTVIGIVLGLVAPWFMGGSASISLTFDTRWTMPITTYLLPGVTVMNPASNEGDITGWAGRSFAVLIGYLLSVDVLMFLLRGLRPYTLQHLLQAASAVLASSAVAAGLFCFSWIAQVEPPYGEATVSVGAQLACLAAFALLWPAKYLLLNYLYAPALFTRPYGEEADYM